MNPVLFAVAYVASWWVVGLGLFFAFLVLGRLQVRTAKGVVTRFNLSRRPSRLLGLAITLTLLLAAIMVMYAGGYGIYNLVAE